MKINLNDILPKILYKYRNFDNYKHRRIITHQEIYYAKPSDFFGATHDCKYEIDRDYIKDEKNRRKYYQKKLNLDNENHPIIDSYIINNPMTDELLNKLENESIKTYDKLLGIFSANETYTNQRLWEVFAANHRGFCLGFNLEKAISLNEGSKGRIKYVDQNDLPKNKLLIHDNIKESFIYFSDLIFNLPIKYQDEQEYRLEKMIFSENERKKIIPKVSIEKIVIGSKMSKSKRNELIELTNKHLPEARIIRLKYAKNGFKEIEM